MNRTILTGRLIRDPELRTLASGRTVAQFTLGAGEPGQTEYVSIVAWDQLAEAAAQLLGRRTLVAVEGRLQTRQWDDDRGVRHWKTEIVASSVELLTDRHRRQLAEPAKAAASGLPGATP